MIRRFFMIAVILISTALLAESDTFFKEVDARGIHAVSVENVNGDITLDTWDRELIQINAEIEGTAQDRKNIQIDVNVSGDRLEITTEHGTRYLFKIIPLKTGGTVTYNIKIPSRLNAEVESVNGHVYAAGLQGALDFSTVNGSLEGLELAGSVKSESVNGSIRLKCVSLAPRCRVETINGSVRIAIPERAGCSYRLETINGKIRFAQKDIEVRGAGPKELTGTLGDGAGKLQVEVINGSVTVSFNEL